MSDTPRTDQNESWQELDYENHRECGMPAFPADFNFARTLERELSAAIARAEKVEAERDALQRQVEAIKRYATTENCDVCPAARTQHCANGGCLENVFKALAEARKGVAK